MARLARYFLPNQPLHVIHRGKGGHRLFYSAKDYANYRDWLAEAAGKYGCVIHAYVLMPDHIHLLATPKAADSLPRTLQSVGRRHVRAINAARKREGTMWEGRYRAAPIEAGLHLLACQRYIELNPVREGLTRLPGRYSWSSYAAHAEGAADKILTDHPLHRALGTTPAGRQRAYAALFKRALDPAFVAALRSATNGGWALGSERFKARITALTGRRSTPLPKGRPRKKTTSKPRKARG